MASLRKAGSNWVDGDRFFDRQAERQADLDHYEGRLKLVLGPEGYRNALDLLTEAAVCNGVLKRGSIGRFAAYFRARTVDEPVLIGDVLRVLEHDGYLEPRGDGYGFVSGLLEDWWRARHGRYFVPVAERTVEHGA